MDIGEIKRDVLFGDEYSIKIKKGVDILADAVKVTMGPKGKLVLIQKGYQHPTVTKDGVTVAQAINLSDEVQNLGATIIKEAAARTADEAGDGTTTSTVLAQSIYNEGIKMKTAGFHVDLLKEGLQLSLDNIKENLNKAKKELQSEEELYQVALISANGEKDTARLIVDAITASGPDGSVIVEEARGFKSSLTVVDGFRLERGYLSPYFVTDKNKMTCEFEKPLILLADKEFNSIHDLMKPLELSLESSKPILIVSNDIQGDAMQGLVVNKTKGALRVCAIKSPGFGISRHDMLNDLNAITGGTIITDSFDMSTFKMEDFGTCGRALIGRTSSMIVSGKTGRENEKIKERIDAIKNNLQDAYDMSGNEKEILNYRLQQLSGGIAILRVGAATESELIERYDRVDDALSATKAAMQEGILPGGGVALAKIKNNLNNLAMQEMNPGVKAGIEVMARSVTAPFQQIVANGYRSGEALLSKILDSKEDLGYDAKNEVFGNMYEIGIIDPHKVVRSAIENAVSAASILLSVGCCMVDVKETHDRNI